MATERITNEELETLIVDLEMKLMGEKRLSEIEGIALRLAQELRTRRGNEQTDLGYFARTG